MSILNFKVLLKNATQMWLLAFKLFQLLVLNDFYFNEIEILQLSFMRQLQDS